MGILHTYAVVPASSAPACKFAAASRNTLSQSAGFWKWHDTQEREAAESAERGRGAAVIAAQLVERQEARLAAEIALKQVLSCYRRACTMTTLCKLPFVMPVSGKMASVVSSYSLGLPMYK